MRLFVRVSPRASRDRIEGVERDAAGRAWLKVRVTAAPEAGAANARVIALIAKALRIAPSGIAMKSGAAARNKTLEVAGDSKDLTAQIEALMGDKA